MRLKNLLFLLLLGTCTALPMRAQDSSALEPVESEDVVIGPEENTDTDDAVDKAYRIEADSMAALRDTLTHAAANDQTPVQVRAVDAVKLRAIRDDRDYQYGNDVPPTASLWSQFWAWFWYKVGQLMQSRAYRSVGQYLLIAAIAGGVIWLLYKADVLSNLFPGRAKTSLAYETLGENIHEINFGDRLNEAVDARNYRLAVRLLYLQTLKDLTDSGLIRWQPDKTNRQYAYELKGNPKRFGFEQLTTQFEYVWYGDFPVDEARFGNIRQQFQQFNKSEPVAGGLA